MIAKSQFNASSLIIEKYELMKTDDALKKALDEAIKWIINHNQQQLLPQEHLQQQYQPMELTSMQAKSFKCNYKYTINVPTATSTETTNANFIKKHTKNTKTDIISNNKFDCN